MSQQIARGEPVPPGDEPPAPDQEAGKASMMSVTDLAPDGPHNGLDRVLQWIPRLLSSKPHVVLLTLLGVYLVLLPLIGVKVSSKSELIGGNYTNVTSDIGACIAAGGTLHLISQSRKRMRAEQERTRLLRDIHIMLRHAHPDAAALLKQTTEPPPDATDR
jgi:hypothetical protein